MANTAADIQKLYIAYFNRPADPSGLAYWTAQNFTLNQIADSFSKQAEYATVFAGKTTEDTVNTIYNNLFGHKADVAGLNYWTGQILNSKVTLGQAALAILAGATGADKVAIDSKVAASTSFTTAIDTNEEIVAYSKAENTNLAKEWLSKVQDSATQASQVAVQDAVISSIVNGGGVKDFTLTSNTDTATAENFTAGLVYTPNGGSRVNALQDEDVLTGSNTSATANNKLTATVGNSNDNGAPIITPTLKNIQTATFSFTGSADANNINNNAVVAIDLQDGTGLKNIGINRIASTAGTNVARIENIKQAVETMSLTNTNANNVGVVEFSFGNGTLQGANTGTLNLSDVQVGTVNIGQNTSGTSGAGVGNQGYETLTINSTGNTNNIGTLNLPMDTGVTGKITITGDKDLSLVQTNNVVNTGVSTTESVNYSGGILQTAGRLSAIDASAFKGNLSINLGNGIFTTGQADSSGALQNVTVTGGSGNDTFYLADTIQAGDSLTGGDGTDTLIIVNDGNVLASSSVVTKIEQLQVLLNGAAAPQTSTVDFSKLPDVVGVTVRNVSNVATVPASANFQPAAGTDVFTLNKMTAAQALAITVQHSDTFSNGITQTTINANLATDTANDTVAVAIANGKNVNPRFNFVLNSIATENVILHDADSESNTVALGSYKAHTGTVTIGTATGTGVKGTFLNLDTTSTGTDVGGAVNIANGVNGLYSYAVDGSGAGTTSLATTLTGVRELSLNSNQVKLVAANVDASQETSNVIVRVSSFGPTSGNGAQNIKMGAGDDTVIFDNVQDTRAGLTISDTVVGGAGNDTLVIDGDLSAGGFGTVIDLGASEWTNVSGFETIRTIGAGAGTSYRLTLTNDLIAANGNGTLNFVNDNDQGNDAANAANTADTAVESAITLDARALNNTNVFTYKGEEGSSATADRIIFSDVNFNGKHTIDGGAADNNTSNNLGKNSDVIELRNATNAAIGDFNAIKNIGTVELTNDTAITQVSLIQLNDNIVDAMVNSFEASNTTTNVERLTIRAIDNINVAGATVGSTIDASALTAKSAVDVVLGRGANNVTTGGGADKVVLLGNYIAGTYVNAPGVADPVYGNVNVYNNTTLNSQSTATAVVRVVTDTINLGAGNDTLVTYGAINLVDAQLSGIENITANSAVVITATQYAALVAARAALSLTGPVLTFTGNVPHQLTIVDNIAGVNNIDLSLISVTSGTLVIDTTSSSNLAGGGVNNITTFLTGTVNPSAVALSGGATVTTGVVGTNPVNGGGTALNPTALVAGQTFNSTLNVNDNFTGLTATLNGTTVNGNAADTDVITLGDAAAVAIGNGTAGGTITNIKTLNLANATNAITFGATTTGITTVNGGTGNDTVDLTGAGTSFAAGNVNLGTGTNGLTLGAFTYAGTFSAGAGTDTLTLAAGANIAGSNISGFENLTLAATGVYNMTAAQYNGFTGTVTAGNTETIALTTAGTIVANAALERFTLANGTNTFTAGTNTVSVVGGTGADTFNYTATQIAGATTLDGGLGVDTLNIGAIGADLDIKLLVTGVETVNVTGSAATGYTFTNENGNGVTLNFSKGAFADTVVLGTGGQTVNLLGTAATAVKVQSTAAGVDTINLSATATGVETIDASTAGIRSNIGAIDTVANFKAAGADVFKTGTAALTLNALNIATADVSTLAAAIASAATAVGAAVALQANTQAYIVTVAAGTAAGTYAFQNNGGTVGAVDATDFIVKLTGSTGSIVAGDFIA